MTRKRLLQHNIRAQQAGQKCTTSELIRGCTRDTETRFNDTRELEKDPHCATSERSVPQAPSGPCHKQNASLFLHPRQHPLGDLQVLPALLHAIRHLTQGMRDLHASRGALVWHRAEQLDRLDLALG